MDKEPEVPPIERAIQFESAAQPEPIKSTIVSQETNEMNLEETAERNVVPAGASLPRNNHRRRRAGERRLGENPQWVGSVGQFPEAFVLEIGAYHTVC